MTRTSSHRCVLVQLRDDLIERAREPSRRRLRGGYGYVGRRMMHVGQAVWLVYLYACLFVYLFVCACVYLL